MTTLNIGDAVRLKGRGDTLGRVEGIEFFYTLVRWRTGRVAYVPTSRLEKDEHIAGLKFDGRGGASWVGC